jgi:hypothetical protein
MKEVEAEKLFMLRLWQDKGDEIWHASLKPMGQTEEAARYFHTIESLLRFVKAQSSKAKVS